MLSHRTVGLRGHQLSIGQALQQPDEQTCAKQYMYTPNSLSEGVIKNIIVSFMILFVFRRVNVVIIIFHVDKESPIKHDNRS